MYFITNNILIELLFHTKMNTVYLLISYYKLIGGKNPFLKGEQGPKKGRKKDEKGQKGRTFSILGTAESGSNLE